MDNFARSWTRAAGYFEITPSQTFVYSGARGDLEGDDRSFSAIHDGEADDDDDGYTRHTYGDEDVDEDDQSTPHARLLVHTPEHRLSVPSSGFHSTSHSGYGSIGTIQSIHGMVGGGLGGSVGSRLVDGSITQGGSLFAQPETLTNEMKEREPLLVKTVENEQGKMVPVIVGQSTLPQTVFNSVNVLIGVGILSLPLGMKYSGWLVDILIHNYQAPCQGGNANDTNRLVGMIYLAFSALVTNYTAKCKDCSTGLSFQGGMTENFVVLARCLNKAADQTLVTYADIACKLPFLANSASAPSKNLSRCRIWS